MGDIVIRPFAKELDLSSVCSLLQRTRTGTPDVGREELFGWKHQESPFGRSLVLVADKGGELVGIRAFMRWQLRMDDRTFSAARAVDTATDPDVQRQGVFTRLTSQALDQLSADTDLLFNTPNEKSLAGQIKLGGKLVGRFPVRIRIRKPTAFLTARHRPPDAISPTIGAKTASAVLQDHDRVDHVLARIRKPSGRFFTPRTLPYLAWRYGTSPFRYYGIHHHSGAAAGYAFFRARRRNGLFEGSVTDLIVTDDDAGIARALLKRVAGAAPFDYLTCLFPPGSALDHATRRAGYLPSGRGSVVVAQPLSDRLHPQPDGLSSWWLTMGDLEVF